MSETKTFKNPVVAHIYTPYDGDEMFERSTNDAHVKMEDGSESFDLREWDVEITFTRKVKPLAVGDVVKFDSWDRIYTVTILAVDDDTYWVRTDSGDYHTLGADDLGC